MFWRGVLLVLIAVCCTGMAYTADDIDLLARLIAAEAQGESYDGMLAVGNVVINRVESNEFPDCLPDVIFQPEQFARPAQTAPPLCYDAAKEICDGVRVLPGEVDMFQRARINKWYGRRWFIKIGSHNFYIRGDSE